MIHVPASSVATVRMNPVAVCVAVTVTPGSTAPLWSVTRPFSSAVAWAQAAEQVSTSTNAETTTSRMVRIMALGHGYALERAWPERAERVGYVAYGFHQSGVADDRCGRMLVPSAFVTFPSHANSWPGIGNRPTRRLLGKSAANIAPGLVPVKPNAPLLSRLVRNVPILHSI